MLDCAVRANEKAFHHLRIGGLFVTMALFLSACGVTYTSPRVNERDQELPVHVVELNMTNVAEANRAKYTPRSLPDFFYGVAGGGSLRGAGAIPPAPFTPNERRETTISRIPPDVAPTPYRIGVGDVVLLATRGSANTIEQLSGLLAAQSQRQGYTVRDDGAIAIPEIGTVPLAGLTLQEAEDVLFQELVAGQIDPSFSIEVAEFNSQRIAVGGAVKSGKLIPLTLNPLTLGEALASAGGIDVKDDEFALIRIYRDGALYQVPVKDFKKDPKLRNLRLQNADAIYVDTTYDLDRAFAYYQQQISVISLRSAARKEALSALTTEIALQRNALEERRAVYRARVELDAVDRDCLTTSPVK